MTNIQAYTEGQKVSSQIEQEFSIRYLNLPITKNNQLSLNFVGIIIKNDRLLILFPKHFPLQKNALLEDSQLLIQVLRKIKKSRGLGEIEEVNTFPLESYLYVCEFFRKFGLYMEQERIIKPGYNGKINWKHTISKSNKVLNNGNIIFIPFMLNKKIDHSVLITTCMEEVLAHGYKNFGRFFNMGVKYSINRNYFSDYQVKSVIKQLKLLKTQHFKDSTLKLIQSLIRYFKWVTSSGVEVHFLTSNFDNVWEEMIHHYLNNHFKGMNISTKPHQIIFDSSNSQAYNFIHKQKTSVKQDATKGRTYLVEYDHIAYDEVNNYIYLMDAKYYEDINGLNYKQFVYSHLILEEQTRYFTQSNNENNKKNLVNGLILPTEKSYFSKIHINRESLDGIYITEHYLNIREVMMDFIL